MQTLPMPTPISAAVPSRIFCSSSAFQSESASNFAFTRSSASAESLLNHFLAAFGSISLYSS